MSVNVTQQEARRLLVDALESSAILVKFVGTAWEAKLNDRVLAEELAMTHQVDEARAFNVRKSILTSADKELHAVNTVIRRARRWHMDHTLPFSKGDGAGPRRGPRILGLDMFEKYAEHMGTEQREFNDAKEAFKTAYPANVEKAKSAMGGTTSDEDYPSPERIDRLFTYDLTYLPMPTVEEWDRYPLPKGLATTLARNMAEANEELAVLAVKDGFKRFRDHVAHLGNRMADVDGRLHQSAIDHVRDILPMMREFNKTNNAEFNSILEEAENLTVFEATTLRNSESVRKQCAYDAQDIVDKMDKLNIF